MEMTSALFGFQYKTEDGQTHDYVVSPEDIQNAIKRCEKLKKLFARGVAIALDKDYIDIYDICDTLDLSYPYGYADDKFDSETFDEERADKECQAIWDKFDQQFAEFFGMTIDEANR